MPEFNEAWLALIGALLGGSGLKFIEHWLSRTKIQDDSAAAFRKELRDEVIYLREELRKAEVQLDEWQAKYFALLEEFSRAKIDRDAALMKIQDAADKADDLFNPAKRKIQVARDEAAKALAEDEQ